ncbi:MAG: RNA 2',3'-cyclic phosphodiesterase [Bacteroidia bacterium]|nr:RNA 2',3'-cyclic phosphodiesterase [Bacteroidia bacterium]MDW8157983.1 RNA 2',3'-cyclic phosphodiesterase [Bacteroidia bacterium]
MKRRLFLAIPLSESIKTTILSFYQEQTPVIQSIVGPPKWVQPRNLHMTVLFLGDVEEKDICLLQQRLSQECLKLSKFTLAFDKFIYAPAGNMHRMVWATYQTHASFLSLCNSCRLAVSILPYLQLDIRHPKAHITLVRFGQFRASQLPSLETSLVLDSLEVHTLELWESTLKPTGAVYNSLLRFELG